MFNFSSTYETIEKRWGFRKVDKQNFDGLAASYNISLLIAKAGKPHTIGKKLILPAIQEEFSTVMHQMGEA